MGKKYLIVGGVAGGFIGIECAENLVEAGHNVALVEAFRQIKITDVRGLVAKGAFILDVCEQREWDNGHIKSATLIPLSELRQRVDEIPKDQPVYIHCRPGQRSYNAVLALQH